MASNGGSDRWPNKFASDSGPTSGSSPSQAQAQAQSEASSGNTNSSASGSHRHHHGNHNNQLPSYPATPNLANNINMNFGSTTDGIPSHIANLNIIPSSAYGPPSPGPHPFQRYMPPRSREPDQGSSRNSNPNHGGGTYNHTGGMGMGIGAASNAAASTSSSSPYPAQNTPIASHGDFGQISGRAGQDAGAGGQMDDLTSLDAILAKQLELWTNVDFSLEDEATWDWTGTGNANLEDKPDVYVPGPEHLAHQQRERDNIDKGKGTENGSRSSAGASSGGPGPGQNNQTNGPGYTGDQHQGNTPQHPSAGPTGQPGPSTPSYDSHRDNYNQPSVAPAQPAADDEMDLRDLFASKVRGSKQRRNVLMDERLEREREREHENGQTPQTHHQHDSNRVPQESLGHPPSMSFTPSMAAAAVQALATNPPSAANPPVDWAQIAFAAAAAAFAYNGSANANPQVPQPPTPLVPSEWSQNQNTMTAALADSQRGGRSAGPWLNLLNAGRAQQATTNLQHPSAQQQTAPQNSGFNLAGLGPFAGLLGASQSPQVQVPQASNPPADALSAFVAAFSAAQQHQQQGQPQPQLQQPAPPVPKNSSTSIRNPRPNDTVNGATSSIFSEPTLQSQSSAPTSLTQVSSMPLNPEQTGRSGPFNVSAEARPASSSRISESGSVTPKNTSKKSSSDKKPSSKAGSNNLHAQSQTPASPGSVTSSADAHPHIIEKREFIQEANGEDADGQPSSKKQKLVKVQRLIETDNGEAQVEEEIISHEEDKRRRNTAASARFRMKKKEREQATEGKARALEERCEKLEKEVESLRKENSWLRSLVINGVPLPLSSPKASDVANEGGSAAANPSK